MHDARRALGHWIASWRRPRTPSSLPSPRRNNVDKMKEARAARKRQLRARDDVFFDGPEHARHANVSVA